MPLTDLVFYLFIVLIAAIIYISATNLDKSLRSNDTLRTFVWALLLTSAILYTVYVSHYTEADTKALNLFFDFVMR